MENRVLMAKYRDSWQLDDGDGGCNCGVMFDDKELVMLYPNPEFIDPSLREMVCLTCHFWFIHEVAEELDI